MQHKGSSIYDDHTEIKVFDHLTLIHMRPLEPDPHPLWTSTYHRHKIHVALLKQLVKLKFNYNVIVTCLKFYYLLFILLIYIEDKFPLFIPSEEKILVQKR